MNKVFIKMLTVSALSVTMLLGASFASSENMIELNPSISIEEGSNFIVIGGNEYISSDTMVVTNGESTFAMFAQTEDIPYVKIMDNAATIYTKIENTAVKVENTTEAMKIEAAKKIVNKNSIVKFQNTVYIYSKELRNLNVEITKASGVITVLNTKNDTRIDLTIKDIMYTSGQGGADCLLPALRVLDELEIDYTIDYDNAKIEVRNAEGNVYYTFE